MRERFLSKAKGIDSNEWREGFYHMCRTHFYDKGNKDQWKEIHFIGQYQIDENTLCQCTGLWDDAGRLIYENDKLSVKLDTKNEFETSVFCINGKFVISYPRGDMFGIPFRDLVDCCDYGHGGKYNVVCKIIGNINWG